MTAAGLPEKGALANASTTLYCREGEDMALELRESFHKLTYTSLGIDLSVTRRDYAGKSHHPT